MRDVVIGMADGLTVPFALAAGITGAIANNPAATSLVVTAGLAEIAAGSIAMGLGGYLAAKTDVEHYESERQREIRETVELADVETEEVAKVFREYGLSRSADGACGHGHLQRSEALGRLHDAIRAGTGRARSQARHTQRDYHRRRLHLRRADSAGALHASYRHRRRAALFNC